MMATHKKITILLIIAGLMQSAVAAFAAERPSALQLALLSSEKATVQTQAAGACSGRLSGDVDADETVSASDARLVLRYAVDLEKPCAGDLLYAEMDGDGVISSGDARLTLRTAVGLESPQRHDYVVSRERESTCAAQGFVSGFCESCGKEILVFLPTLPHDFTEPTVTPATCTKEGSVIKTCRACGFVLQTVLPATGHRWIEASASAPRHCADCGEIQRTWVPQGAVFTDRFGNTAALYKQNPPEEQNAAEPTKYNGRYQTGYYRNGKLLPEYLTTWNGNIITGKVSDKPTLKSNGCGPVCCAIIATSFGYRVTPYDLVRQNNVCYSTRETAEAYFRSIGLKTERINRSDTAYRNSLAEGKKLMVLTGTSSFSKEIGTIGNAKLQSGSFHWYAILDYDDAGNYYVADPYLWNGRQSNCGWIGLSRLRGIYTTIAVGR